MHEGGEGPGGSFTGEVGSTTRAAAHVLLDTSTTHWYFTHFLCDDVGSWATAEGAHLKTDLHGEIVSSYTSAYDALNRDKRNMET